MRLLCVIDNLGSGGAQRQMVALACGMRARGHDVYLFYYHPEPAFYRAHLERQGIRLVTYDRVKGSLLGAFAALRSTLITTRFDVVISFLDRPNLLAEIVRLTTRRVPLVVSERSSYLRERPGAGQALKRLMHAFADHLVANSKSHGEWLSTWPWLRNKVSVVYNGVDTGEFASWPKARSQSVEEFQLLGIGRVGPEKGLEVVIRGLDIFHRNAGFTPRIYWAGRRDLSPTGLKHWAKLESMLEAHPHVAKQWKWLGERRDIPELLNGAHALVHPSYFEGLPNAICEALAAGCPVIASDVCDHPVLVKEGCRGFLFDPGKPEAFAEALFSIMALDEATYMAMSINARRYAEDALGMTRMVNEFEMLLRRVTGSAVE